MAEQEKAADEQPAAGDQVEQAAEAPAAAPDLLPADYDPFGPDTAAIPAVDELTSTRELPPVREPLVKPFAVDSSLTGMFEPSPMPGEPPLTSSVPVSPVFAAHAAPTAPADGTPPTQASAAQATGAPTGTALATGPATSNGVHGGVQGGAPGDPQAGAEVTPKRSARPALILAALAVVVVVALGFALLPRGGDENTATPTPSATTAAPLSVSMSSMDPVGGSGFRKDGSDWVTQTYTTASFGNLKPGVGLVLDLGSAKSVSAVRFTANGVTAQLRAADADGDELSGWTAVGSATGADGSTTLRGASGGSHRYWMIWVTKLASSDGGYSARLGGISVTS